MALLFGAIVVTLVCDALLIALLHWVYRTPRFADLRLVPGPGMQVAWANRVRTTLVVSVMSLTIVFGSVWLMGDAVFTEAEQPWWWKLLTVAAIVLVYDFMYYAGHRTMHHPVLFKRVHGIHHRARNPSSVESFYQHPLELVVGLSLFFGTTVLMRLVLGPIHVHAFALLFFLYSQLNILNHAGFETRMRGLRWFDWLSQIHHVHHYDDPDKNFATITLLPDLLFGTLQTWTRRR